MLETPRTAIARVVAGSSTAIPALENNLLTLGLAAHSDHINTERTEVQAAPSPRPCASRPHLLRPQPAWPRPIRPIGMTHPPAASPNSKMSAARPNRSNSARPPPCSKCIRTRNLPVNHPTLASFFQTPKSSRLPVGETASKNPTMPKRTPPRKPHDSPLNLGLVTSEWSPSNRNPPNAAHAIP